jgi:hypothetical protein
MPKIAKYHSHFSLRGNLTSLLLVIILLFNVCGYFILFNVVQKNIRREIRVRIREGTRESELTLIEVSGFNDPEIKWIEPDKEFTYHGNMYDVVKIARKGGKQLYYCIDDVKEKELIVDFQKKHESNQKARKLLSNITTVFTLPISSPFHINEASEQAFCVSYFDIKSKIREVADPPPKAVFTV